MAPPIRSVLLSANQILKRIRIHQTELSWCRTLRTFQALRQEENLQDEEENKTKVSTKRKVVDVATSIRYLESEAFKKGYGDKPVWFHYRRNFKGRHPPPTRKSCIRQGEIANASPCPMCRDEYLVADAKNVKLLEHFVSPISGEIYDSMKTGLCQMQHRKVTVEIMRAWDEGRLEMKVPFRTYNYDDYKN